MTTPLLMTAPARDAAPCADVVSLDSYRERRRATAAWRPDDDAPMAAAAGEGFTLDRFLERARLVLLEGGGSTPPSSRTTPAPLRLA